MARKRKYSDVEIVEAIRKKTETWNETIKFFYYEYYPLALKIVTSKGGSKMDAEDIYQDAICDFQNAVLEGRFEEDRVIKPYLTRIIYNLWNDALRYKYRFAKADNLHIEDTDPPPDEILIAREYGNVLDQIFSKIGKVCAELLGMRFRTQLKLAEIAARIGLESESAAKMRHFRCKKELKALLLQEPELLERLRRL